jgi:hypothetical protein
VTGEEIVQFDGKTWRIAEFSSDPYNGEIGLTLIQHADAGTTDLSIETVRDTEGGGTSSIGGGTAPAVGGGGSVAANTEIAAFRPGSLSQGALLLSHYARHEWTIESVLFVAGTPPSSNFDFEVSVAGTTVTVTLPSGKTQVQQSIGETLTAETELRVTAQSNDADIADIRTSFDVS